MKSEYIARMKRTSGNEYIESAPMSVDRFSYQSGEKIKKGDRVLYDGEPAEIAFVAESITGNPEVDYCVEELGGGVMVKNESFGGIFLTEPNRDCELEFVSRAGA